MGSQVPADSEMYIGNRDNVVMEILIAVSNGELSPEAAYEKLNRQRY